MRNRLYFVIGFLFALLPLAAQEVNNEQRQIYAQAEAQYQIGQLDQAMQLLEQNIPNFTGTMKQNAFRLLSLCYLAQDNEENAEKNALLLLNENPYYTSVQDPPRFADIINRLKLGKTATITTASSHAERIEEAPVPVTIITSEMIERLGYNKTLGQILAVFVPGITEVASNNLDNIAKFGAYTSNQEKILIMENGHRLNARSTNAGRVDYAISTNKIDHIEVLRGPASSLYGNVALTAVVNIITKDGVRVNGFSSQYGYGNNNTHKADLLAGATFLDLDVLAWGGFYSSRGEDRFIPQRSGFSTSPDFISVLPNNEEGYAHINKYNDKPSYDVGMNLKFKDLNLMFSRKSGKKVAQYSMLGHTYDYDAYRWYDGQKPGYGMEENHMELSYDKTFGPISLSGSVYGDLYGFNDYAVASDGMDFAVFNDDGSVMKDEEGNPIMIKWTGAYQIYDWKEMTLGTSLKADYSYHLGAMTGSLLVGGQYEFFSLYDTYALVGENFDEVQFTISEEANPILTGRESCVSFFMQDKHYFNRQLILNAGLRYDLKNRANHKNITALSPRVAFVYMPSRQFSMKLSYSRSFVDAPYFYRRNTDNSYKGGEDLKPEYLNSVQFDILGNMNLWNFDFNLFYNYFTDVVFINSSAELEEAKYGNSGQLQTVGAELVLGFHPNRLNTYFTACYNYPLSAQDYYYSNHNIFGISKLTANLGAVYTLFNGFSITALAKYASNFYVPTLNNDLMYEVPSSLLFDLGARYQLGRFSQISIDCENIFDKTTYVSGAMTTIMPWYKPGRTVMASLKINI